ncbi:MAG: hypothetical protein DYG96_00755 [Chlorobi bacterium CHB2]|nr:hypothetical protein [Chlorobi bacterium CHB2]
MLPAQANRQNSEFRSEQRTGIGKKNADRSNTNHRATKQRKRSRTNPTLPTTTTKNLRSK